MEKIKLHYLVGDVHMGGHDVQRVAKNNRIMLERAGCFEILMVCDNPDVGDVTFDRYFDNNDMEECQVFVFDCGNHRFNIRKEQERFEHAVAAGAGCVFLHGQQVCYWKEVGMAAWEEVEKMQGLLWRNSTQHGDYGDAHVTIQKPGHPIMQGLTDFDTKDEIFCRCENVHQVPLEVLATAYSDREVISRHGLRGTEEEHPRQFRQMFVRACEWAATGEVDRTLSFDGKARLI